jgi:carbon-monoxide dehydrogenase large subunit
VFTNTPPIGTYRGAGRPEATFVIERLIDLAARETGRDPIALRRLNLIPDDAFPADTGFLFQYDCGAFARGMNMALEAADIAGFTQRRREAEARGRLLGLGFVNAIEQAGSNFEETAELHFDRDGGITLTVGTISNGQGHETAYAQILDRLIGPLPGAFRLVQGDTDAVRHGTGTFGSRSASVGGAAVALATNKIVAKATRIAAHHLEVGAADIFVDRGIFRVAGTDRAVSLAEIAALAYDLRRLPPGTEPGLTERAVFVPSAPTFPNGVHVCEAEVDPETGAVTLPRYTVVDDVGRIVNPMLLEGQIHGGIAQGAGQALLESIVYTPDDAQLLTGSLMDYAMPRADLLGAPAFLDNSVPTSVNPLGVKGAGEAGTVGALPAVVNAVLDAVAPLGVRHIDMPLTPRRVWEEISARSTLCCTNQVMGEVAPSRDGVMP